MTGADPARGFAADPPVTGEPVDTGGPVDTGEPGDTGQADGPGEAGTGSLLPDQTSDDLDADWRDRHRDDTRLLEDRPPHWE